jgi:transposase
MENQNYQFFVGLDIAKDTVEVCLFTSGQVKWTKTVNNSVDKLNLLLKELDKEGVTLSNTLFCMEHTGLYNYAAICVLSAQKLALWVESALQIKLSMGIQRGKSDSMDAQRIAQYAARFTDKLQLYTPQKETLTKLADLLALRERLVSSLHVLKTPIQEIEQVKGKQAAKVLRQSCKQAIAGIEKSLEEVEEQIRQAIEGDDHLKDLSTKLQSITGIGEVTASEMIVATEGFTKFKSAKALACYCGVAPFEHSSGKSVRGKTKVSHMANKRLKTLLHTCAMSAIQVKGELRDYFQRKVAQGKNKMSVLNAIRNKLVHRMWAVVRDSRKYDKNKNISLA